MGQAPRGNSVELQRYSRDQMRWGVAQSGMAVALNRMANPGGERE
jgi:hypothetical protein